MHGQAPLCNFALSINDDSIRSVTHRLSVEAHTEPTPIRPAECERHSGAIGLDGGVDEACQGLGGVQRLVPSGGGPEGAGGRGVGGNFVESDIETRGALGGGSGGEQEAARGLRCVMNGGGGGDGDEAGSLLEAGLQINDGRGARALVQNSRGVDQQAANAGRTCRNETL